MKSIDRIILALITLILIGGITLSANAQVEELKVEIHFPAQIADISTADINYLDSLMSKGWYPVLVGGFANSLPNLSTGESNESLAARRAHNVAATVELKFTDVFVMSGGYAEDRKAVVVMQRDPLLTYNEQNADSTIIADNTDITNTPSVDSNDTLNAITNPGQDIATRIDTIIVIIRDTVYMVNVAPITIESVKSDCCGCNKSLQEVWTEYKNLQLQAKKADTYESRQLFTSQARVVRGCWVRMYSKYRQQENDKLSQARDKQLISYKPNKKFKHSKLPRRTRGLNATIWTRIFPWAAC
jgi:hypothetical protein